MTDSGREVEARRILPILWFRYIGTLVIIGIISLLAFSGCGPVPLLSPTYTDQPAPIPPTLTPDPARLALAETGVSSNSDWEPYIQEFDGVLMALVPAGCFMMGSEDGDSPEMPVHEVCFEEPFWIDVYEVTNEQYGSSGSWSGDDLPREKVNWPDAVAHCESRGVRLPTEAEWEYAARGPDSLIFPWGNTFDGSLVNFCDKSCPYDHADKNFDDGYKNTAPVGSYPGGVSWVGAYDLIGNVWEWVNDWYGPDYYSALTDGIINPQGSERSRRGEGRGIRGSSWVIESKLLYAAHRAQCWPGDSSYLIGFRCARSFEP